ncbi:Phage portal protein, SPP1 Gp6-like [Streptosporangium canum]|uniref:Phage portal protein, SPP1 Gp6-like n=1 Tax=Streptosporangium canum TaxID=324952 RepID=A0A1I3LC15_9ACTN|nr:phage portal protein [Streptosporangium canum]SFI82046.1 Phage portal protein, SPP1 Gp6-like [Streptosporangium canum]
MALGHTGGRPQTPLEWIAYLEGKLSKQRSEVRKYATYYDSENKTLNYAQQKFSEIFGDMFVGWRDNFCPLIVDSISERLRVQGFRMGPEEAADKDATEIWQYNSLDAESNAAHIDALMGGASYLVVWGDEEDMPLISPESAEDVVVQYEPGSRRKRAAAMKQYIDDWGVEHATLWLPDGVYTSEVRGNGEGRTWTGPERENNPLDKVPVVPLYNRTRLKLTPFSELASIIPVQDAINKVAADALVASEFAAFPQRILAGIEQPPDNATDSELEQARQAMIRAYVDRILTLDNPDAKWGQFEAADLKNYVVLIDMLVQHMASQSRVPFHYFLLNGGQAPSGESITAAEAGLVAKAKERMLHFGESWEEAMRLAFEVKGDTSRAKAYSAEVIWEDPEYRSKAQQADALLKLKELNVPVRQLQEEYGYTPTQILRFDAMREEEMKRQKELDDKYGPELVDPLTGKPTGKPGQPGAQQPQQSTRGEAKPKSPQDKVASVERQKKAA